MNNEATEEDLLRRARSHDVCGQDVLGELIRRLTPRIHGIVRQYRLGRDVEFDILQNTWLQLLQNLHTIREPDRVVGWLWTTASREALRALNHRRREVLADVHELDISLSDGSGDGAETAAERLARAERDQTLWRVVDRLPERDRLLAELMAREPGASCARVASLIGVAPGSVSQLRTRCLRRLRRLLLAEGITNAGV